MIGWGESSEKHPGHFMRKNICLLPVRESQITSLLGQEPFLSSASAPTLKGEKTHPGSGERLGRNTLPGADLTQRKGNFTTVT